MAYRMTFRSNPRLFVVILIIIAAAAMAVLFFRLNPIIGIVGVAFGGYIDYTLIRFLRKQMASTVSIQEEGIHDFFWQMPNIVDDWGLDPYSFRLYCHLKRVAGDNGGTCWQSARTMAKICKMSTWAISKAKQTLQDEGLIRIEEKPSSRGRPCHYIAILNIWAKNHAKYTRMTEHIA